MVQDAQAFLMEREKDIPEYMYGYKINVQDEQKKLPSGSTYLIQFPKDRVQKIGTDETHNFRIDYMKWNSYVRPQNLHHGHDIPSALQSHLKKIPSKKIFHKQC